jgi:DNA repair exonuclease SbcCD ATPase subunit
VLALSEPPKWAILAGFYGHFDRTEARSKAMRIAGLTVNGFSGWPGVELSPVMLGVNVVYGPAGSGKTTIAEFLTHVLYGQPPSADQRGEIRAVPDGEAVVESSGARYRLRRAHSGAGRTRLTVSSLEGAVVDHETVRRMLGGLSPFLLRRLCAISFREPPQVESLLSAEFAREFGALGVGLPTENRQRTEELLARRDSLAKELETRLAGEGKASRELDARRLELDRQIDDAERKAESTKQRFHTVESALTETDTRLKYRRLELNADRTWWGGPPTDWEGQLAELDAQIARWRTALAELASREATVRSRLAEVRPSVGAETATIVDEQAWLAVARQLAADLSGEVARLARASASQQCVCRGAHPRLRPIVDTFQRQLDVLAALLTERQQELTAAELEIEAGHLSRSQAELARQLEYLLDRRQAVARGTRPARRITPAEDAVEQVDRGDWITTADAEQLEQRRLELEQQRFELSHRLTSQDRVLRDLRARRAAVDRQRAALLSARSIEHIQRELAVVQQKLQQSLQADAIDCEPAISVKDAPRASDVLAKLTDGRLVRLQLVEHGRKVRVWKNDGNEVAWEELFPSERDQVYISLCLALTIGISHRGISLPLLLDEPFLRLDAQSTAALAAVLDDLGRHGQQFIVFTGQREAAKRLEALGASVNGMHDLRRRNGEESGAPLNTAVVKPPFEGPADSKTAEAPRRKQKRGKRPKLRRTARRTDSKSDQSDAA